MSFTARMSALKKYIYRQLVVWNTRIRRTVLCEGKAFPTAEECRPLVWEWVWPVLSPVHGTYKRIPKQFDGSGYRRTGTVRATEWKRCCWRDAWQEVLWINMVDHLCWISAHLMYVAFNAIAIDDITVFPSPPIKASQCFSLCRVSANHSLGWLVLRKDSCAMKCTYV